jgi:hypothetical protein
VGRIGTVIAALPLLVAAGAFLLILSPFILVALVVVWFRGIMVRRQFRQAFAARGTPAIVVYSDSPHWRDEFETRILPRLGARGVVLNWSERKEWRKRSTVPIRAYEHHRPSREFNPYALVFRPRGRPVHISFYSAFHDRKHGSSQALESTLAEFWSELDAASDAWKQSGN